VEKTPRITTYNETSVHAALKCYLDPDTAHHEVRIGRHIADVRNDSGVFEIQTRGFFRISKKLETLLTVCPVTLVYPAAALKRIFWIDPRTGELTPPRTSPRRATFFDLWRELPSVAELLSDPGFSVRVLLLSLDEYRALDGYGPDRKHRASHVDRVLREVTGDLTIASPDGLRALIPADLPDGFSSRDFARAAHLPLSVSQSALRVLNAAGIAERTGRDFTGYHYHITKE
jgi:hypothetical protein